MMKDLHVLLVLIAFVATIHGFTRLKDPYRRNKPKTSWHLSRDLDFNHLNTLSQRSFNAGSVEVVYERYHALAPRGTSKERTTMAQPRNTPTSRNFSSRKKRFVKYPISLSQFEPCRYGYSDMDPDCIYYEYNLLPLPPFNLLHVLLTEMTPPPTTTTRTTTTTPTPTTTRTTTTTPAPTTTRTTTTTTPIPTTTPVPAPHKTTTMHCYKLLSERYPVLANNFWNLLFNDCQILRLQAEKKIIRFLSDSSILGNQSPLAPTPTQKKTKFPLKMVDFLSRIKRSVPDTVDCLLYGISHVECVRMMDESSKRGLGNYPIYHGPFSLPRSHLEWTTSTSSSQLTTATTKTTTTTTSPPQPTPTTKLPQETTPVPPESFRSNRPLECYDLLGERYRFLADIFWDMAVENCDYYDESEIIIDSSIQNNQDTPIPKTTTIVPPPTSTGKTTTTTIPTTKTTTTKPTTSTTTTKPTTTTSTTKPTTSTTTTKPTTTTSTPKPTTTTSTTKPTTTTSTTIPTTTTPTTTSTTKLTATTRTTKRTTTKPTTTASMIQKTNKKQTEKNAPLTTTATAATSTPTPKARDISTPPTPSTTILTTRLATPTTKPTTSPLVRMLSTTTTKTSTATTTKKPTTTSSTTPTATTPTTTTPTTTSLTTTEECPETTTIHCYTLLSELYPVLAYNLRDVFFNDSQIIRQQAEKEINRLSIDSSVQINRIPPIKLSGETDTFQQEWLLSCQVVDCYNLLIESYPFLEDILWGMVMELEKSFSNDTIDFNIDADDNHINTTNTHVKTTNTKDENATQNKGSKEQNELLSL